MLFKLQKNNNPEMKEAYGNYYALPVILQTMGIAELAVMMAEHNTGFSAGQVKGMLTDMVKCIKQLVLDGKAVKIDDLAIFTLGIVNKAGAATKAEFSVQKNIESVKLRARATGELTRAKLNLDASLKDIEKMVSTNSEKDGDGGTPLKPGAGSTDQKDNTQEGGAQELAAIQAADLALIQAVPLAAVPPLTPAPTFQRSLTKGNEGTTAYEYHFSSLKSLPYETV